MSHRRRPRISDSGGVATWTARTRLPGPPEAVLALLTDPDAIATWAPVGFELVDYEGRRLIGGSPAPACADGAPSPDRRCRSTSTWPRPTTAGSLSPRPARFASTSTT